MHTVTDFNTMMERSELDHRDRTAIGHAGLIDTPVDYEHFYGRDGTGRVFVNLPITIKNASGVKTTNTIVIYQRYTNRNDVFALAGLDLPFTTEGLISPHRNNLYNLQKLLDGKTLCLPAHDGQEVQVKVDFPSLFRVTLSVIREVFAA